MLEADALGDEVIRPGHLLLALLSLTKTRVVLREAAIERELVRAQLPGDHAPLIRNPEYAKGVYRFGTPILRVLVMTLCCFGISDPMVSPTMKTFGILLASRLAMRRNVLFLAVGFITAAAAAAPAFAQQTPAPGMWAVGGSIGVTVPADASLDNGLEVAGTLESYLTSRLSVRGQLGGSSWDIAGRGFTGTVKPVRLDGNLVYNWEGGVWHPYVTAGLGMYRYRSTISGALNGTDTDAGVNVGGGIEYFFRRRATFTGEALYHRVGPFNTPVTTFNAGSFWSFDVGLKAYIRR